MIPTSRAAGTDRTADEGGGVRRTGVSTGSWLGFRSWGTVDRAVALSGIFTAIVRGVLPTAPLHAIRAHTPGTGKSFLVDLASTIASGRRCPVIAAARPRRKPKKRLGALLRDAVPVVSTITSTASWAVTCSVS